MSPQPDRRDGASVGVHENPAGHEVRLPAERSGHAQGGGEKEIKGRQAARPTTRASHIV